MFRVWTLVLLAAAALLLPLAAPADDWPQFGKDERHTRATLDRVPLPLTDLWWLPGGKEGTFWRGRYYYVATHSFLRWLVCVDSRTGMQLWQQALEGLPETPGVGFGPLPPVPTVSTEGLVYVHDWARQAHRLTHVVVRDAERQRGEFVYTEHRHHYLRVFNAHSGMPLGAYPAPVIEEEPAARVYLADGFAPLPPIADKAALWHPLGAFALSGNTLHTLSAYNTAIVWRPGERAGYVPVYHAYPNQPEGGVPVLWTCYPLTVTGAGMFVSGWARISDTDGRRVYAVLNGSSAAWHRDLPYIPGIASTNGGTLFIPMQGRSGSQITALDGGSGITRWQFPPEGVPPLVRKVAGMVSGGGFVNGRSFAFAGNRVTFHDDAEIYTSHALTLTRERVYGELNGSIIALGQESGQPAWRLGLGRDRAAGSMLATAEHLISVIFPIRGSTAELVALNLDNGNIEHRQPLRQYGELATADSLLFLRSEDGMRALAPAERTFHVAVDSSRLEHYRAVTPEEASPAEPSAPKAAAAPGPDEPKPVQPADMPKPPAPTLGQPAPRPGRSAAPLGDDAVGLTKHSPALADATILRLDWSQPPPELIRKTRERKTLCPTLPMVLSLDWLDATRARVVGPAQAGLPTPEAFLDLCRKLARELHPEFIDLAPEVNVYLARDPSRLPAFQAWLRTVVKAVKEVSPDTRTLVSLNAEVLSRQYGKGSQLAFGKMLLPEPRDTASVLGLSAEVDVVGFTSHPRSAFKLPKLLPYDYLLRLKAQVRKPILVTRISVPVEKEDRDPLGDQRRYLRRVIQAGYWLNARLVAYPDVSRQPSRPDDALLGEPERPALSAWQDLLAWRKVERLTADPGTHPLITFEAR